MNSKKTNALVLGLTICACGLTAACGDGLSTPTQPADPGLQLAFGEAPWAVTESAADTGVKRTSSHEWVELLSTSITTEAHNIAADLCVHSSSGTPWVRVLVDGHPLGHARPLHGHGSHCETYRGHADPGHHEVVAEFRSGSGSEVSIVGHHSLAVVSIHDESDLEHGR